MSLIQSEVRDKLITFVKQRGSATRLQCIQVVTATIKGVSSAIVDAVALELNLHVIQDKTSGTVWAIRPQKVKGDKSKHYLTSFQRKQIAEEAARMMLLEVPSLNDAIAHKAAISAGFRPIEDNLPKGLAAAIKDEFKEAYGRVLLNLLEESPVIETDVVTVDISKAHPADLIKELLNRGPEAFKEVLEVFRSVPPPAGEEYLPLVGSEVKRSRVRVFVTGLSAAQISDFKQRPRILSNTHRIDFRWQEDKGVCKLPAATELVLAFKETNQNLYKAMIEKYGKEKVQLAHGLTGMEQHLLEYLQGVPV